MALTVAMVLPLQGPGGIYAPSAEAVTELAVAEINAAGGIRGQELRTLLVDGGAPLPSIRAEVASLLGAGTIDAVSGWHISPIRDALAPVLSGRVPYLYSALYEGGEGRSGIYCTGEVPAVQLNPALGWLKQHRNARRWFVVGDDYSWPKKTFSGVREQLHALDLDIVGTAFSNAPERMGAVLEAVAISGADAVLVLMVGQNAALFNREFARRGLQDAMIRLSPLMEENTLLASGADATVDLYSTAAYFRSLATTDALDLLGRYQRLHGAHAPALNSPAESCYEALQAFKHIAERAASMRISDLDAAVDGADFTAGRGHVSFSGNHLRQPLYLALANGFDFEVVARL